MAFTARKVHRSPFGLEGYLAQGNPAANRPDAGFSRYDLNSNDVHYGTRRLHSQHRAFGTNKNLNFPIRRGFVAAKCPSPSRAAPVARRASHFAQCALTLPGDPGVELKMGKVSGVL
jgi:hypothetical protein